MSKGNRYYAKGREYEYQLKNKVNDNYGKWLKAERVLLSGQRGEGDVLISFPTDTSDGEVWATELKARKAVPKVIYEWLGEHDLLVVKKIGREYGWLAVLDLDRLLTLLARVSHNFDTADNAPKNGNEDDSAVL